MPVTKDQFLRQEILIGLLGKNKLTRSELLEKLNFNPKEVYDLLKGLSQ